MRAEDLSIELESARPRHEVGHDGKQTDVYGLWLFLGVLVKQVQEHERRWEAFAEAIRQNAEKIRHSEGER